MGNLLCGPSPLYSAVTSGCLGPLVPSRDLSAFLHCFVRAKAMNQDLDPRNKVCLIVVAGDVQVVLEKTSSSGVVRTARGISLLTCPTVSHLTCQRVS